MSAEERFLKAIESGASQDALFKLGHDIENAEGAFAWSRCIDAWMAKGSEEAAHDVPMDELYLVQAQALERAAAEDQTQSAIHLVSAYRCLDKLDDDLEKKRVGVLAVLTASGNEEALKELIVEMGGKDHVLTCLQWELKKPDVKKDRERTALCRQHLALAYKSYGDVSRAFFEMLKAFRKKPKDSTILDEMFSLALASSHAEELVLVLLDLADDEQLTEKKRATLCNKAAHLQEKTLNQLQDALETYEKAHQLNPGIKGPVRNIERIKRKLEQQQNKKEKPASAKSKQKRKGKRKSKKGKTRIEDEIPFLKNDSLGSSSLIAQVDAEIIEHKEKNDNGVQPETTLVSGIPEEFDRSGDDSIGAVFTQEAVTDEHQALKPQHTNDIDTELFPSGAENHPFSSDDAGYADSVFTQEQKDTFLTPSDVQNIQKNFVPGVTDPENTKKLEKPEPDSDLEQKESGQQKQSVRNQGRGIEDASDIDEPPPLPPDSESEPDTAHQSADEDEQMPPPLPLEGQFPTVAEFEDEKTDVLDVSSEEDTAEGDPTRLMSINDISEMTDIEKSVEEPPSFIEDHGQVEIIEDQTVEAARAAVFLSANAQEQKETKDENEPRIEAAGFDDNTDDSLSPFAEPSLPSGRVEFAQPGQKPLIKADATFEEESIHTRIDAALDAGNSKKCAALIKSEGTKLDPETRLQLLGCALFDGAEKGVLDDELMEHLAKVQAASPDKTADLAIKIKAKMPIDSIDDYLESWLVFARSAQHWEQVETLLEEFAILDAPEGEAFRVLDSRLKKDGQTENRYALREQSIKRALDDKSRVQLILETTALFEEDSQWERALDSYRVLILEYQQTDSSLVADAIECFQAHSSTEELARFISQLLRIAHNHESELIYRQMLIELRREANDALGAEAAARELLAKHPGDHFALEVLSDLLRGSTARHKELIEILEMRKAIARNRKEVERFRKLSLEIASVWETEGKDARVLESLQSSVREFPADEKAVEKIVEIYKRGKRFRDWISFLVELAENHTDQAQQIRYFSDAARVASRELKKTGRAKELLERALDVDPDHEDALRAKADLAIELGHGEDAIHALERLLAQATHAEERSGYHLKIGQILEEQLLKPDDALKRYFAATNENSKNVQAWRFLVALARLQDSYDELLLGLNHLHMLSDIDAENAIYLKEIGVVYRDEKGDSLRAEEAFAKALQRSPLDEELFFDLIDLVAGRLEEKLSSRELSRLPSDLFLEEIQPHLFLVLEAKRDEGDLGPRSFPFELLVALHYGAFGEERTARELFEKLYAMNQDHCALLQGYESFLGVSGTDAQTRREILEKLLLHHAPSLDKLEQIALWADVATLRWRDKEESSGRKAIKMALALAVEDDEKNAISDEAITVAIEALEQHDATGGDERLVVVALQIAASRAKGEHAAEFYRRAAGCAQSRLHDIGFARRMLIRALEEHPGDYQARDQLIELELQDGDGEQAISSRLILLAAETEPTKKAEHHIAISRLVIKVNDDLETATQNYLDAVTVAPENTSAHTELEDLYRRKDCLPDLESIYTKHLKTLSADAVRARVLIFQRLAQLRRYELRDSKGAIEALEAIVTLNPNELKAREDAARLYADAGQFKEAIEAWRGVLEREPVSKEAWRSIFSLYGRQGLGDHAYRVAETMNTIEIADQELSSLTRKVRPPFPCWPKKKSTSSNLSPRISHALARTPLRNVMQLVGPLLQPAYAQPLKAYGLSRRKALQEHELPSSVMIALRTGAELLGLEALPKLYPMQSAHGFESGAEFALLPAAEPGILVSQDVLSGGITPTRAFALGRLMVWLSPQAILTNCVDPSQLQMIVNTLCKHFLPPVKGGDWGPILPQGGKDLEKVIFQGLNSSEKSARWHKLVDSLERYAPTRKQVHISDWLAGVGYTGDRFGFFLSGDLTAGVRILQESTEKKMGARLAIKELVLYSVSDAYFRLREEFDLQIPQSQSEKFISI